MLSLLSCLTLCDPMDYNLSGSSVHGILQARTLEWVDTSFSKRNYRKKESEVVQSCPPLYNPIQPLGAATPSIQPLPQSEIYFLWSPSPLKSELSFSFNAPSIKVSGPSRSFLGSTSVVAERSSTRDFLRALRTQVPPAVSQLLQSPCPHPQMGA